MEGLVETQRALFEEIDRLVQVAVNVLVEEPRSAKARLLQEHHAARLLDRIVQDGLRLCAISRDGRYSEELRREREGLVADPDLSNFYGRLKSIKDYHRRQQSDWPGDQPLDDFEAVCRDAQLAEDRLETMFSGEESFGRQLDLHLAYDRFVNLKAIHRVDYLKYLDDFDRVDLVPKDTKATGAYSDYLTGLVAYLEDFFARSMPLFDLSSAKAEVPEPSATATTTTIYCDPCNKPFANESVFRAHLSGKKHTKALKNGPPPSPPIDSLPHKEALVRHYTRILASVRENTKLNVERKLSRTVTEREEDAEYIEADTAVPDEPAGPQGDAPIYNPLNLPLDWDGKPIPYWLWKLHGLGVSYPCEICGNYIYKGRKAFDMHFNEWRHVYGLKCLGIPSTKHFFQVTSIADALALWDKLKQHSRTETFRPDAMEECEDQHGNVYSRKTYEDLRRQGLL